MSRLLWRRPLLDQVSSGSGEQVIIAAASLVRSGEQWIR